MSVELDTLATAVEGVDGEVDSVITLVTGLSAYIKAHANDPAAILAYAKELTDKRDALAAAVAANPLPEDGTPTVP